MGKIRKQGLFLAVASVFTLSLAELCPPAWAQDQPITFSVMADIPYNSKEAVVLQKQIAGHNKYSPSEFIIHLGDMRGGKSNCMESEYRDVAGYLKMLAVPCFIIPGDNEYNDCSNPVQGWSYWVQYFMDFEKNFCGTPATARQSVRPENFAFVRNGVLFIGINLVSGAVLDQNEWNTRLQQDADWVSQQFQAKVNQVRAAVIFAHDGPNWKQDLFFNQFRPAASAFGKPVLFMHGSDHAWIQDNPFPEPNILRVSVNNGGAEDPVEVTVTTAATMDPNSMFTLKRKPWSSQAVYNMPPCVNAGPDQTIALPSVVTLQGSATDDGDPNPPGALTVTWNKKSGPDAVTFGNANALTTTAHFNVSGTYVLRLTANDGALQNSDELTIIVSSSIVYEESQTGGSSGSTTVTTSANLTGVSGHLYLAAISTRPKKNVLSVSGLGLSWTLVKSICAGQSTTGMD
ncbi:MAG: PKD domain-containing protein, partial [bacterium]